MKGYLFDLDGVLTDTAKYHYLAWKETAEALGIPFTHADNENLKGVSRRESLEWILKHGSRELPEADKLRLMEVKNERYLELIEGLTQADLLPGLPDYLIRLRELKKNVVLGSSSKNARAILERLGILELFDVVIDGTQVRHAKPDPEVFLLGAYRAGLPPEECLVFEDAAAGIAAAKAAGMLAVGVGLGISAELQAADLIITGFDTEKALQLMYR